MDSHDDELFKLIIPIIKSRRKAEQIIQRYYRDKITIVWMTADVHRAANELEVALTEKEALQILQDLQSQHNKQYGLNWHDLIQIINDQVLGRKLTKREVKQFVIKDKLIIQR